MAKDDGMGFDDDLDLGSFDDMGDLGGDDFGDLGLDTEKNRKPSQAGFWQNRRHYLNKAKDGALEGMQHRLSEELPEADKYVQGIKATVEEAKSIKDDFMRDIRPSVNQTKIVTRRIAQQAQNFIPKSIYDKIMKKLEVDEEQSREKSAEQQKKEARDNSLNETLNAVFRAQMSERIAAHKEAKIDQVVDRRMTSLRHAQSIKALDDIRAQTHFQSTFMRTTLTAWMKKDLELKIRSMYLQEDTLIALKMQNDLLTDKLDKIRHNTALPEFDKITAKERVQKQAYDMLLNGVSGFINNYGAKVKEKVIKNFVGPAKELIGSASDIGESLLMGMQMTNMEDGSMDDDAPMSKRTLIGWLSGQVGKIIGSMGIGKVLDNVPEEAKAAVESILKNAGPNAKLMLSEMARGRTPRELRALAKKFPGLTDAMKGLAGEIAPKIDHNFAQVTNATFRDPTGQGKITNRFTTTVEDIIPGYLRLQLKTLEAIAQSPAINADIGSVQEKVFDFKNREFVGSKKMLSRIQRRVYGTREEQAQRLSSTMASLVDTSGGSKYNFQLESMGQDVVNFSQDKSAMADVAVIISNIAASKREEFVRLNADTINYLNAYATHHGDVAAACEDPTIGTEPRDKQDCAEFLEIALGGAPEQWGGSQANDRKLAAVQNLLHLINNSNNKTGSIILRNSIRERILNLMQENDQYQQKYDRELNSFGYGSISAINKNTYLRDKNGEVDYSGTNMLIGADRYLRGTRYVATNDLDKIGIGSNAGMIVNEKGEFERVDLRTEEQRYKDENREKANSIMSGIKKGVNWALNKTDRALENSFMGEQFKDLKFSTRNFWNNSLGGIFESAKGTIRQKFATLQQAFGDKLYARIQRVMLENRRSEGMRTLAAILFSNTGDKVTLNKNIDIAALAGALSYQFKGENLRGVLRTILAAKDSNYVYNDLDIVRTSLGTILPDQLKIVAEMSEGDYAEFRNIGPMPDKIKWLENYLRTHTVQGSIEKAEKVSAAEQLDAMQKAAQAQAQDQLKVTPNTQEVTGDAQQTEMLKAAKEKIADQKRTQVKSSTGVAGGPAPGIGASGAQASVGNAEVGKKKFEQALADIQATFELITEPRGSQSYYEYVKDRLGLLKDLPKNLSILSDRDVQAYLKDSSNATAQKEKYLLTSLRACYEANDYTLSLIEAHDIEGSQVLGPMISRYQQWCVAHNVQQQIAQAGGLFKFLGTQFKEDFQEKYHQARGYAEEKFDQFQNSEFYQNSKERFNRTRAGLGGLWDKAKNTVSGIATKVGGAVLDRVAGNSSVIDILEKQLAAQQAILVTLAEKDMIGIGLPAVESKAKKVIKGFKGVAGAVSGAIGATIRGSIALTGLGIRGAWGGVVGTAKFARHAISNRICDVYVAPKSEDGQLTKEDLRIQAHQFEVGVYADPNGKKRIESVADIRSGEIYNADGIPLLEPGDWERGLVDANGKPINSFAARSARLVYHSGKWVLNKSLNMAGWGLDIAKKAILPAAMGLLTSPFRTVGAAMHKYIDIYRLDEWEKGNKQPLVTARDQRDGFVTYENGKPIKDSYSIDHPLIWVGRNPPEFAISPADLEAGLCDAWGKPLNALARKLGRFAGGAVDLGLKGLHFFGQGVTGTLKTVARGLNQVRKFIFDKKNPYISVYVKDEQNNWDPKNPVMLGIEIEHGKYCYADGETITSAYGIKDAVFEKMPDGSLNCVVKEDEVRRLCDVNGKALTKMAGRSLAGKALALAGASVMWTVKKAFKTAGAMLRAGGRAVDFLTRGIFSGAKDVVGLVYGGLKDILGTVFHGGTMVTRKDLEEVIGKRLLDIYNLLDIRLPGRMLGDADGDGDRDGSYQDAQEKAKSRKEKNEAKRKATRDALAAKKAQQKAEKQQQEHQKKMEETMSEAGESSWMDYMFGAMLGKDALGAFKNSKWGRRIGALGKLGKGVGKLGGKVANATGISGVASKIGGRASAAGNAAKASAQNLAKRAAGPGSKASIALGRFAKQHGMKGMSKALGKGGLAAGAKFGLAGAGKLAAAALRGLGGAATWAALAALGSYIVVGAGSKLSDWIFGSKEEHSWKALKLRRYGVSDDYDDEIEDLEDELKEILDGARGAFTENELEDFADDFGILDKKELSKAEQIREALKTDKLKKRQEYLAKKAAAQGTGAPGPKKPERTQKEIDELLPDTKTERQRFFNTWLTERMYPIFTVYYGIVRDYTHTQPGDDLDNDDIPAELQIQAMQQFDREAKQYADRKPGSLLVLDEKHYQAWRAEMAGKIAAAKASGKGLGGKSAKDISKDVGGAATVLSTEDRLAKQWKTWREWSSGKAIWDKAKNLSWWNPVKWGAAILRGAGAVFDFLVNDVAELVMNSPIGSMIKKIGKVSMKGGIFSALFSKSGRMNDEESTWFDSRMKMYGWPDTGMDVSYATQEAVLDLEKKYFAVMVGEKENLTEDDIKDFGKEVRFIDYDPNSLWNRAKAGLRAIGGGISFGLFGGRDAEREKIKASKSASKAGKMTVKGQSVTLADLDTPERRMQYLTAWVNARFAPTYAIFSDIVIKAAEQEPGEEPDVNRIPQHLQESSIELFEKQAPRYWGEKADQLCPTEQAYQMFLEALTKDKEAEANKAAAQAPENQLATATTVPGESPSGAPTETSTAENSEENKAPNGQEFPGLNHAATQDELAQGEPGKLKLVTYAASFIPFTLESGWFKKFLGNSDRQVETRKLRFTGYGFTLDPNGEVIVKNTLGIPAKVTDKITEFEEDNFKVLSGKIDSLDDDDLQDFAAKIGFKTSVGVSVLKKVASIVSKLNPITWLMKSPSKAKTDQDALRTEYVRNWYDAKFMPILGAYYDLCKQYNAIKTGFFGGESCEPDLIEDPEEYKAFVSALESKIKQITSDPEVKSLVLTEDGFLEFLKEVSPDSLTDDQKKQLAYKDKDAAEIEKLEKEAQSKTWKERLADAYDSTKKFVTDKDYRNEKLEEAKQAVTDYAKQTPAGDALGLNNAAPVAKPRKVEVTDAAKRIWKFFKSKGWSDEGIAALMGNLDKESGLRSIQLQNDIRDPQRKKSEEYLQKADKNKNAFLNEIGFGLAQWTTPDRKSKLWDYAHSKGKSVGDLDTQLEFLNQELESTYKKRVTDHIRNTRDVADAARIVLQKFEVARDRNKPSEISDRASRAQGWYNQLAGKVDLNAKDEPTSEPLTTPEQGFAAQDGSMPSTTSATSSGSSSTAATSLGGTPSANNDLGIGAPGTVTNPLPYEGPTKPLDNKEIQEGFDKIKPKDGNVHLNYPPAMKAALGKLNSLFMDKFGSPLQVNEGVRSLQEQAKLFAKYGPGRAARPNPNAPHIKGFAADIQSTQLNKAEQAGLLEQAGLYRPFFPRGKGRTPPEPWHVELKGYRDGKVDLGKEPETENTGADGSVQRDESGQVPMDNTAVAANAIKPNSPNLPPAGTEPQTASSSETSTQGSGTSQSSGNSSYDAATAQITANANVANPGTSLAAVDTLQSTPIDTSALTTTGEKQLDEMKDMNGSLGAIKDLLTKYLDIQSKQDTRSTTSAAKSAPTSTPATSTSNELTKALLSVLGPGSEFMNVLKQTLTQNSGNTTAGGGRRMYPDQVPMSNPINVSRS